MNKSLRPARLFTFAAVGFAVLAPFLEMVGYKPGFDLYIHDVYFVIPKMWPSIAAMTSARVASEPSWIVNLIAAAICGMFALLYFGCGRLLRIPLNRGLSLANFLLIVLPLSTLILELNFIHPNFERGPDSWVIKAVLIAYSTWMICFVIGCMLFVLNLSWTLVRVVRTRA
jgi:hypothetical protein